MSTMSCNKFKGGIENYLNNGLHNFESKIDGAFSALKFPGYPESSSDKNSEIGSRSVLI